MGAWRYISPYLERLVDDKMQIDVISRPERSSPATGFWDWYIAEQEQIITKAITLPLSQRGGKHVH
jgi:2-oxoglutarate dehydrogenase E1 component